ncbi:MAG: hypothetical protein V1811_00555 [Candidatus Micrarchaeota archaeon]
MAENKWMIIEDIPNIDFFFSQIWLRSFVNNLKNSCGMNLREVLAVFKGTDMCFYYDRKNCFGHVKHLIGRLEADQSFGDSINANIVKLSDELEESANRIPKDFSGKTNEELWKSIDEHVEVHTRLYEWAWLSNATDMFYPEFTNLHKN